MAGSPSATPTTTPQLPAAPIKLRLLGGAYHGRIVVLSASKCTLGSADHCTLRLRTAGIEPVHCSIDRTTDQTTVERLAGEAWLNGESLERGNLQVGDRLKLGTLEFEVLEDARPDDVVVSGPPEGMPERRKRSTGRQAEEFRKLDARLHQLEAALRDSQNMTSVRDDFSAYQQTIDQRLESLAQLERSLHEQPSGRAETAPSAGLDFEERLKVIQACLETLASQQSVWNEQRDEFRQELQLLREFVAERSDKLGHQLIQLEAKCESLDQEQRRLQAAHDANEAPLNIRPEHVEHRLAGIRAEREAFEHDRQHHAADRGHAHPGERKDIDERLAEIQANRHASDRPRNPLWDELNSDRRPADDDACEEAASHLADADAELATGKRKDVLSNEMLNLEESSDAPPTDTLDDSSKSDDADARNECERDDRLAESILSRYGRIPEPAANERQADDPAAAAEATDNQTSSDEIAAEKPAEETNKSDGEESIDDYMARLMQRVRSISGGSEPSKATEPSSRPAASMSAPASRPASYEVKTPTPEPAPETKPLIDLSQLNPRVAPPELTTNISAMRDLANSSARNALDAHTRQRLNLAIYSKLCVAAAGLAAAVTLTWFARNGNSVTYAAALVGTLVAAVWGLEYLVLSGNWYFHRKPAQQDAKSPEQS